jgi:hypothetical protein
MNVRTTFLVLDALPKRKQQDQTNHPATSALLASHHRPIISVHRKESRPVDTVAQQASTYTPAPDAACWLSHERTQLSRDTPSACGAC